MNSTAVIILSYNSQHFLSQFLPVLIKFTHNADLWVVDNNSSDGTIGFLNQHFKNDVKCLQLPENLGFAGGYNKAIEQIEADNLILLNSDVEVSVGWLEPLLNQLEKTGVGAVQPKILAVHNKQQFEYAGGSGGYIDIFGYPFCRGRVFDFCELDDGQYDDTKEIFWASGACFAIKKKYFINSGGFDERFFAHMEEIDLCWRLKRMGLHNYVVPASKIYHVGGGALPKSNSFKTFLNFRNGLLLLLKNLPAIQVIPVIFSRLILDGVAALKFLVGGEKSNFYSVVKAHFAFYSMVPYGLKMRKKLKGNFEANRFNKSVVWQHFVLKKTTYNELIDD